MHELRRRAYLDAMGVDTYLSRAQLPGAAPTKKLVVVKAVEALEETPATIQMPAIDLSPQSKGVRKVPSEKESEKPESHPAVEFSVTTFRTGQWLWLEQLPRQQALMRDQVLLVQAMAQALGWGSGKPDISQFNWPIHNNTQLALGEDAARASLGGFIMRKFENESCRGIVILGTDCQRWLPEGFLENGLQIATVSTSDMLHNPPLKKQAWRDLWPHAG
jgi:hypothetical protein